MSCVRSGLVVLTGDGKALIWAVLIAAYTYVSLWLVFAYEGFVPDRALAMWVFLLHSVVNTK